MDCIFFIRLEAAVSWTQRFLTTKIWPKTKFIYEKQIWKQMFAEILRFKSTRERMRSEDDVLPRGTDFRQHFMRRTTQQTFSAINLASQQKTTKLFFSSQVRKQLKLLAAPFKSLRCCLRSDKLVNCHVWKFRKDLFLNFRVVNQIVLFWMASSFWFWWDHFLCEN